MDCKWLPSREGAVADGRVDKRELTQVEGGGGSKPTNRQRRNSREPEPWRTRAEEEELAELGGRRKRWRRRLIYLRPGGVIWQKGDWGGRRRQRQRQREQQQGQAGVSVGRDLSCAQVTQLRESHGVPGPSSHTLHKCSHTLCTNSWEEGARQAGRQQAAGEGGRQAKAGRQGEGGMNESSAGAWAARKRNAASACE